MSQRSSTGLPKPNRTVGSASAQRPRPKNYTAPRKAIFRPPCISRSPKRKGSNAVWVANEVDSRLEELSESLLPVGVHYRITRDYGETANDKVNELVEGLVIAVITVVALIGLTIGWRAALVVALAIPVCYSLTLFVNLLAGYTINRVTMFALILALGLLVGRPDHRRRKHRPLFLDAPRRSKTFRPQSDPRSTASADSFDPRHHRKLPAADVHHRNDGPRTWGPMALNVPLTVTLSTVVAFLVTPWLAMVALQGTLKEGSNEKEYDITTKPLYRFSNKILRPILHRPKLAWFSLGIVALLLVVAMILPALRVVPLKMLPYDNKNEFQIVIDMPEGTTLDRTDSVARRIGTYLSTVAEVRDYELFVGEASPMDFNGMVRHYFLRQNPHEADIRVNLAAKEDRQQWSHEITLRLRNKLKELADAMGANIKLVEVPPGPPVMATIHGRSLRAR